MDGLQETVDEIVQILEDRGLGAALVVAGADETEMLFDVRTIRGTFRRGHAIAPEAYEDVATMTVFARRLADEMNRICSDAGISV